MYVQECFCSYEIYAEMLLGGVSSCLQLIFKWFKAETERARDTERKLIVYRYQVNVTKCWQLVNINEEYMCSLFHSCNFSVELKTYQIKSWWKKSRTLFSRFVDSSIGNWYLVLVIPNYWYFAYVIGLGKWVKISTKVAL